MLKLIVITICVVGVGCTFSADTTKLQAGDPAINMIPSGTLPLVTSPDAPGIGNSVNDHAPEFHFYLFDGTVVRSAELERNEEAVYLFFFDVD